MPPLQRTFAAPPCPKDCGGGLTRSALRNADVRTCDKCGVSEPGVVIALSCYNCDVDYCAACAGVRDDRPATRPRQPATPRRTRFADEVDEPSEGDDEASDDPSDGENAEGTADATPSPRKRERQKSRAFHGHVSEFSWESPGAELPPGTAETPDERKVRKLAHEAWGTAIRNQTNLAVDVVMARVGVEARIANRMLLKLCDEIPGFIDQLRTLGFLQREHHVAKCDVADTLEREVFNDDATLRMQYDEHHSLSTRQLILAREVFNYASQPGAEPGRVVISVPPKPNPSRKRDPDAVSAESNLRMGISPQPRLLPYVFKHPNGTKALVDERLAGEDFYLAPEVEKDDGSKAFSFDACARPALSMAGTTCAAASSVIGGDMPTSTSSSRPESNGDYRRRSRARARSHASRRRARALAS